MVAAYFSRAAASEMGDGTPAIAEHSVAGRERQGNQRWESPPLAAARLRRCLPTIRRCLSTIEMCVRRESLDGEGSRARKRRSRESSVRGRRWRPCWRRHSSTGCSGRSVSHLAAATAVIVPIVSRGALRVAPLVGAPLTNPSVLRTGSRCAEQTKCVGQTPVCQGCPCLVVVAVFFVGM